MADLQSLYDKYGINGLIPLVERKHDAAYSFLVAKLHETDALYLKLSTLTGLVELAQAKSGRFAAVLLTEAEENTEQIEFDALPLLTELGASEIVINNAVEIALNELFEIPRPHVETAHRIFEHQNNRPVEYLFEDRDEVYALSQIKDDSLELSVLNADYGPSLLIFENDLIAGLSLGKLMDGRLLHDYHYVNVPFSVVNNISDEQGIGISIGYGTAIYRLKESVVDSKDSSDDFIPDFLK